MGIDLYARWKGQGEPEPHAQLEAGFRTDVGDIGYLREAYHGEPYATKALVPEAFARPERIRIPAAILRSRLPQVLKLVGFSRTHFTTA